MRPFTHEQLDTLTGAATKILERGSGEVTEREPLGGGVAELLVGVVRDPAHGFVLTIAAGGVMTEILQDSTSLLLPVTADDVTKALDRLRIAPILRGYRGKAAADSASIVGAVLAVQAYVTAHAAVLEEIEINPLICGPQGAIAADALIRIGETSTPSGPTGVARCLKSPWTGPRPMRLT